jgi:hypothetical protein
MMQRYNMQPQLSTMPLGHERSHDSIEARSRVNDYKKHERQITMKRPEIREIFADVEPPDENGSVFKEGMFYFYQSRNNTPDQIPQATAKEKKEYAPWLVQNKDVK